MNPPSQIIYKYCPPQNGSTSALTGNYEQRAQGTQRRPSTPGQHPCPPHVYNRISETAQPAASWNDHGPHFYPTVDVPSHPNSSTHSADSASVTIIREPPMRSLPPPAPVNLVDRRDPNRHTQSENRLMKQTTGNKSSNGSPPLSDRTSNSPKDSVAITSLPCDPVVNGEFVGLYNYGNTCYMSAIFQCLLFTPSLRELCLNQLDSPLELKLTKSLGRLFDNMMRKSGPKSLKNCIQNIRDVLGKTNQLYLDSDEQDAVELLACVLDLLHSEFKQLPSVPKPPVSSDQTSTEENNIPVRKPRYKKGIWGRSRRKNKTSCVPEDQLQPDKSSGENAKLIWEEERKRDFSAIKDLFMTQMQIDLVCSECSSNRVSYDVAWTLSVPIPNLHSMSSPSDRSLDKSTDVSETSSSSVRLFDGYTEKPPAYQSRVIMYTGGETEQLAGGSLTLYDGSSTQSGQPALSPKDASKDLPPLYTSSESSSMETSPTTSSSNRMVVSTESTICLTECLQKHWKEEERLDGTDKPWCDNCCEKTTFSIQHRISRLPDILVIHILRYNWGLTKRKNDTHIRFDMKLDMSQYLTPGPSSSSATDHIYWLYAVVYHHGELNHGHYTAACRHVTANLKDSQDQWYLFNDERVQPVSAESIDRATAYLLFYERDPLYQTRKSNSVTRTVIDSRTDEQSELNKIDPRSKVTTGDETPSSTIPSQKESSTQRILQKVNDFTPAIRRKKILNRQTYYFN